LSHFLEAIGFISLQYFILEIDHDLILALESKAFLEALKCSIELEAHFNLLYTKSFINDRNPLIL